MAPIRTEIRIDKSRYAAFRRQGNLQKRKENILRFYPSIFLHGQSPVRTMFPLKTVVTKKDKKVPFLYNDVNGYNQSLDRFIDILKNRSFGRLLVQSYRENIKLFGLEPTLHGLMDFVCVRSLKHNAYPFGDYFELAGDYFELDTLAAKLAAAGWKYSEINRALKIIVPLKKALDDYFGPFSKLIEQYNQRLSQIPKDRNQERQEIKAAKESVLDKAFRDSRYNTYKDILAKLGIISDRAKKKTCKTILRVLYAQRALEGENTLGKDIRTTLYSSTAALKKMNEFAESYFKKVADEPSHPIFIFLLGDGEILNFVNKVSREGNQSEAFLLTRKQLLSGQEWGCYGKEQTKSGKWNSIDHGSVLSHIYSNQHGNKSGQYIEAYNYAVRNGNNPAEIMTLFTMRFTELSESTAQKYPHYKKKVMDEIAGRISPVIERSAGNPLIFCDAGLKGTFVATLSSLVELHYRNKNEPSIFTSKPRTGGFIFSIDEDYSLAYPHYSVGIKDCMLISDAPRMAFYDRDAAYDGVVLSKPAHNMLALIFYKTFLELLK